MWKTLGITYAIIMHDTETKYVTVDVNERPDYSNSDIAF